MQNCIFTIVATNYVGLAQALEESIKKYNANIDFYIIVADEPTIEIQHKFNKNTLIAKEILQYDTSKWYEMAFKYNLTEFCTSIKPASVLYFFEKGYEKVSYFDPDILTFNNLGYIWNNLDYYDAIVTPHILTPEVDYTGNLREIKLLFSGVFNMGFGAYRNTNEIILFLKWWKRRLEDYCFGDSNLNLFTDQKWVDMLPCFLGNKLLISRNKGLNVAPWNFHERKIILKEGVPRVLHRNNIESEDDLLFVHYSGYNYKTLLSGEIIQQNIFEIKQYDDLIYLFNAYEKALKSVDINIFINESYSYNYFEDINYELNPATRRIFRGYVDNGNHIDNPFSINTRLFDVLTKKGFVIKGKKFKNIVYQEKSFKTVLSVKIINAFFAFVFLFLGATRYYNLIRMLRKYSIWENHSFLITRKGEKYSFRRF